ncbi:uncharacterized protein LOC120567688 [Perca fluviatilis]|uniref:uncharacterized protein LOC120567688 n=1 Tax=Perca fluviatilis TaxID=8168 RepID=UPI0019626367|nr:uncharacterized protein LOC120567688 [Perca fluviatilis]
MGLQLKTLISLLRVSSVGVVEEEVDRGVAIRNSHKTRHSNCVIRVANRDTSGGTVTVTGRPHRVRCSRTFITLPSRQRPWCQIHRLCLQRTKLPNGPKHNDRAQRTLQPHKLVLEIQLGPVEFSHSYLFTTSSPVNLMGRDILKKLGASILCGPLGLTVTLRDGTVLHCTDTSMYVTKNLVLAHLDNPPPNETADIYWGLLKPESPQGGGISSLFTAWKPWITSLHPYLPPADPHHVTLNYLRTPDEVYEDEIPDILDTLWDISSPCLYVGKEGVASEVTLTEDQAYWYRLTDSYPHVSLAIHAKYEARQLGPMVKRLRSLTDWQATFCSNLFYSPSEQAWKISTLTHDQVVIQHEQLSRFHGRERTDHPSSAAMLDTLPASLWSSCPTDVGHTQSTEVNFDLVPGTTPIHQPQYPLKPQADEGIADTISGLLQADVLRPCTSPWNTPILPVPKPGTEGKYRMVHDLRAINAVVATPPLEVPNPHACLSSLSPTHSHFTVIDLANAFFCLPLAPELQDIFAFTFRGQKYTYNRMPQGFVLSPGLFNHHLRNILNVDVPPEVVLIQYVDDLLIAAPSAELCLSFTKTILEVLAQHGFKVSKSKIQLCRSVVTFLGREISHGFRDMSPSHRDSILHHPLPHTVRDMLSFLGLIGYSRNYISNFTDRIAPFRAMISSVGHRNLKLPLTWLKETEDQFISLKQDLACATSLAVPDYKNPFCLDVSEAKGVVNACLFQKKEGGRRVLYYYSQKLDSVKSSQPPCVKFAAGVAKAIQKTAHIIMVHQLTVLTTHSVVAFLSSKAFTLSGTRSSRVEHILTMPNLIFTHDGVNMAEGMMTGELHCCESKRETDVKLRTDLFSEAIPGEEGPETLYTDGCCYRHETKGLKAAYAVVRQQVYAAVRQKRGPAHETVVAGKITDKPSAQRAELKALSEALKWGKGKIVNIYTDSAYAHGVIHYELSRWYRAGFVTASGTPIKHQDIITELAANLQLPLKVAVVKCKGHQKGRDDIIHGNESADAAAKEAAGYGPQIYQMTTTQLTDSPEPQPLPLTIEDIKTLQNRAGPYEWGVWTAKGAIKKDDIWRAHNGRVMISADVPALSEEEQLAISPGEYHTSLKALVSSLSHQVQEKAEEAAPEKPRDPIKEGEWVWLRVLKRKWNQPRWTGPHQVEAATSHSVRLVKKGSNWYHQTLCARASDPQGARPLDKVARAQTPEKRSPEAVSRWIDVALTKKDPKKDAPPAYSMPLLGMEDGDETDSDNEGSESPIEMEYVLGQRIRRKRERLYRPRQTYFSLSEEECRRKLSLTRL